MFNSAEPRREGQKDGRYNVPPNRGYYDEAAWLNYLAGYDEGKQQRSELAQMQCVDGA